MNLIFYRNVCGAVSLLTDGARIYIIFKLYSSAFIKTSQ